VPLSDCPGRWVHQGHQNNPGVSEQAEMGTRFLPTDFEEKFGSNELLETYVHVLATVMAWTLTLLALKNEDGGIATSRTLVRAQQDYSGAKTHQLYRLGLSNDLKKNCGNSHCI
jgi:hypothetical protein